MGYPLVLFPDGESALTVLESLLFLSKENLVHPLGPPVQEGTLKFSNRSKARFSAVLRI